MPFKLAAKASGSFSSSSTETAEGFSASTASDVFVSIAQQASQSTEMKRSITVSTFEDKETIETTKRVLHNANKCYAVNYFVRRVLDVYEVSTKIVAVTFEIESRQLRFGPISIDQIDQLPSPFGAAVKAAAKQFPTVGERTQEPKRVSVPTDGVVYLPELAHCCAQDPALEAATLIALEREKAEAQKAALEVQLMALEVQRRQALLAAGTLDPFVPAAIAAPA